MTAYCRDYDHLIEGRAEKADKMVSNEVGETYKAYLMRMERTGSFGDAETVSVAALALRKPVHLHVVYHDQVKKESRMRVLEHPSVHDVFCEVKTPDVALVLEYEHTYPVEHMSVVGGMHVFRPYADGVSALKLHVHR
jgi:hypothetical protein